MRACVFLLLTVLGALPAAAADRELTGRVVDADTGEPIARARVTLRFWQGNPLGAEAIVLSDVDGAFHITNVPEGGFQVTCEKAGYLTGNQGMASVPTADGKAAPAVSIKMTAQAAIEGTVVDDKDAPAENTFIQLVRQQVVNGRRQLQVMSGGSTDETGYFRLFGLAAGRYYISISARLSGARRTKPLAYPTLFYPNATEAAAAQAIDLKAGDDRPIRIRLPEPVPAFEVRGAVAAAATNVSLMLIRQPPSQGPFQPTGDVNWDAKARTFRISRVTPGIYMLTAGAQDGKSWLQATTMVTVGNADVTGIRLEPSDSGIDGTVRVEGGAALLGPMFVSLQSATSGNGGQTDADGKFHVPGLRAETYRVTAQVNGPLCVRSVLQSGRDVRDGLVVAGEGAPAPLEIVLTGHCGGIEGTLALSDSKPPGGLTAVLLRKAGEELALEKQTYIGTNILQFRFQNVTPGEYTLYVWPQDAQIEYANAEYMRQFESYGNAVTVTEDGKVSVTVDKILTIPAKN